MSQENINFEVRSTPAAPASMSGKGISCGSVKYNGLSSSVEFCKMARSRIQLAHWGVFTMRHEGLRIYISIAGIVNPATNL